ncbi:bidirectional sugar transporter SWEET17-like isoform X2 [Tasmannia lanceolata]|uniref:bidirectional sugar transporter SWEET17-like isoform X2 n=1 Tax=Tasmannia lanceolata TaxID=3420 RepID=UPI0040647524
MQALNLSFYVGVIGNVISVLMFASPIPTFWRVVKSGSTEDFEGLPYVCTFLSASLWVYYGISKPGELLVATVNGLGIVLEFSYITLFLIYSPPIKRINAAILAAILDVGVLGGLILVTHFAMHGELRIDVIGFICAGLSFFMYGSPLAAMTVITRKSVEYMPFFLSFFLFLNGGVWAFYAVLLRDLFVGVPNGVGFLLGTAQLILYAIYYKPEGAKTMVGIEEARQRLIQQNT